MGVGDVSLSRRTFTLLVGGLALIALVAVSGESIWHYLPAADAERVVSIAAGLGAVVLGAVAAATMLLVGLRLRRGNPLARIWLLLGAGVATGVVARVVSSAIDAASGPAATSAPSAADVFHLAMYVLLALGLTRTAISFGRVAHIHRPMTVGILATVAVAAAVFVTVVLPVIADPATSLAAKALGAVYPMAAVILLAGPAAFIVLAAPSIGPFRVTRQWWMLGSGLLLIAASDVWATQLGRSGDYFAGHPVDFGWMLGLLLVGVAGSLAASSAKGHRAHSDDAPDAGHDASAADSAVPRSGFSDAETGLIYSAPGNGFNDED
jgi:hypothetical protein